MVFDETNSLIPELGLSLQEEIVDPIRLSRLLVGCFGPRLYPFVWLMLEHEASGEALPGTSSHVIRETFFHVLNHRQKVHEQASLDGWFLGQAVQEVSRLLTRNGKINREIHVKCLRLAIPMMFFGMGMTLPEIASALGESETSVGNWLKAARDEEDDGETATPPGPDREAARANRWQARLAAHAPTNAQLSGWVADIQSHLAKPGRAGFFTRLPREWLWVGVIAFLFFFVLRSAPYQVIEFPTPQPFPTITQIPLPPGWDIQPVTLPLAQIAKNGAYVPENPFLVWRATHRLRESNAGVSRMAFSPVESLLAVGQMDNVVVLWDMERFEVINRLQGHSGGIHGLAFSQDGRMLASGGGDSTIRIWEMPSGNLLQVLEAESKYVNSVAFSPDRETLAAASGQELWLWQINSGMKMAVFDTFEQTLESVAYSPDGQLLAIGGAGGTAWVLRASDGYPLLSFVHEDTYYGSISAVHFSAEGEYLATVLAGHRPAIIQLEGDAEALQGTVIKTFLNVHDDLNDNYFGQIQDIQFSPDGRYFAVAPQVGQIFMWDTQTWSLMYAPLDSYEYENTNRQLAISWDGQMIAASQANAEIQIWQLGDVSEEVLGHFSPRFFERMTEDVTTFTYTFPDPEGSETLFGEQGLLTLQEASEQAGFDVQIPFVELLLGGHRTEGFHVDPLNQAVYASFWASNQPGPMWGFNLVQMKIQPGEKFRPGSNLFLSNSNRIGVSAVVEPFQVGEIYGEIVTGDWTYLEEDNPNVWNIEPEPGEMMTFTARWEADVENTLRLRWQDGGILYEIDAYRSGSETSYAEAKEALILLATSMFAPEEIKFPVNASSYTYLIQPGDTCASLAETYHTTTETFINLNRLSNSCELTPEQEILIPYPAEILFSMDLNCDGQGEKLLVMYDVNDLSTITGVALEVLSVANIAHRVWEHFASEMGTASLTSPQLIPLGDCEHLIALSGGTPTNGHTRIFRWNGNTIWPVLDASGWIDPRQEIAIGENEPLVIPIIEYVPDLHPAGGYCPNRLTAFTWNGQRFVAGPTRTIADDCISPP